MKKISLLILSLFFLAACGGSSGTLGLSESEQELVIVNPEGSQSTSAVDFEGFTEDYSYNYFPDGIPEEGTRSISQTSKANSLSSTSLTSTQQTLQIQDLPNQMLAQQILEPNLAIQLPKPPTIITTPPPSTGVPKRETQEALRLDATQLRDGKSVVVFERLIAGEEEPTEIVARTYDVMGNVAVQDKVVSDVANAAHAIDPTFQAKFPGLTEPKCDSWRNPSVEFVRNDADPNKDRILIAYEAHCTAKVVFPDREQFFVGPNQQVYDLDKTHPREQRFIVVKLVRLNANLQNLPANDADPLKTPRAAGILSASYLFNADGANGKVLKDDTSIYKWSSSRSPHLSKDTAGNVLLTYQTNRKVNGCLSNRVNKREDVQATWYDELYSVDAQLIAQNRGPVRVVFRSKHTGADGQEAPKDLCRNLEKNEVESAFEPVSAFNQAAAQDAGFAVMFSVENGRVSEHHDHLPLLDKTLADRFLPEVANAIPALPLAQQTSYINVAQLGLVDMSQAYRVHNDEYKHVESDLRFVPAFDVFAAAHDAGGEIHVFLLENNAALLPVNNEAHVQPAENFPEGDLQDLITRRGDEGKTPAFRPQISSVLQEELGESFVNKLGIAYEQKRGDGEWDVKQNYFRFTPTDEVGVLALGFERAGNEAFNLSDEAAAELGLPKLQHSSSPVPLLTLTDEFGTGEAKKRFQTFWVGLPQQVNGYIYNSFANEGVPPIAAFTVTDAAANNFTWNTDEVAQGERRLNQLDEEHHFVVNLADAGSMDPDSAGDLHFTWEISGLDNDYAGWQGAGNNASNRNTPIIAYGTYMIRLTVKDQDGLQGTSTFNLTLEQNQVPVVTQLGVVNANGETPLDANNPPLFAVGSEIQLHATANDAADANATPAEDLTFTWSVTLNNNALPVPAADGNTQTIPLNAAGLYQVTVVARDADGGASPSFVRSFNVNRLDVLTFTSNAVGGRIPVDAATVPGGSPTGTVQLRWTTQLADRVELFKIEFDENGQQQAEEPLGIANLPLNIAAAQPAQQMTMDRHTRYILRAFNGEQVDEQTLEVSFSNPTVTALSSPAVAQGQIRLNLVDSQAYGETRLDWALANASQIVSLAQEVAGQQPVLFGYRAQAGQDQDAAFPLPRFANNRLEGESFVRPTANSSLRLTVRNPDGVTGNRALPVLFNAPVVNSFSVVEAEGFPESAIHLNWQTHNATSVSVKLIRNGQPLEIAQLANNPAQVFAANRFEVSLPNFAADSQAQIRIDVAGPGGNASSQLLNINLLAINLRINSFSANPDLIDLDPATVAGHPAPDAVYGITRLRWQTEHADAVQLFKVVGGAAPVLVPASELLDNGDQDQAARPLPLNFADADNGIRVRVNQDTSFLLRASSVVAGVPHSLDSQVPVSFNPHTKTFVAPATINYNNQTRNGTVPLTWTSSNIKQVVIKAYEWANANQAPARVNGRVIVDGANANLALNQAQPLNDTISRKTTYVAEFTQLSGQVVILEQTVSFVAPTVQDFTANPQTLDFAANQTTAQTQLIWHTQNTSRVTLSANNVAVNLVDPAPDGQGVGNSTQQIGAATHYVLTAFNPDGASVTRELDVTFNDATLTLADVVSSEGEAELYHGRGARVSWNNIRNVASMTLYLADAAGNRVAGNPTRAFANLQAVNTPPWDFTLPNPVPAPASVNYRIRAELANPNGAQPVVVLGAAFTVRARPAAVITTFAAEPIEIVDLVEEAGQVVGHSTLTWQTTGAAAEQPVTALEEKVGAAAYRPLAGVALANLQASDSVQLTIPANVAQNYRYRLTVQNRFNDTVQRETAAVPLLHFAAPTVPGFNIAEGEAFPNRNITVSWQTRTATSLDVVLIRGAQQTILLTDNVFATVSASNARAIQLPAFVEDNVQAQLKLVARGPGGTVDSALVPITLRQVPVSGVFRFCAPDSNAVCGINSSVNFDANAFQATVELQWVVNPAVTGRVDHICVGARPANDGTCVDSRINLPPGANFVDQGNGNGIGGTSVQINSAKQYWLVTQAVGEQILTVYDSPVNVSFNAPSVTTFSAARNLLNQNLQTNLSWNAVQNATDVRVEVLGQQNVSYFDQAGGQFVALPFTVHENAQSIPNGSLLIASSDAGQVQLRLTATGPGGNITRDVQLTVNQVPEDLNIITPNVDLNLFAPTKLAIQWNAAPEEQLQAGDVRKVDQYAICYDVYKSNAQGVRGERLVNVGAPCPDLSISAFASINDFPANLEYVDAAAAAQYTHVLVMDPKLNDPNNPQRAAFLRYEIGVIAIDSNDQLLGLSKSTRTILTDDSVEAWYKFAENFTAGQVCAGGAAGASICDSGRFAHHATPVGGPAWANPGIILNPQDQRTQWAAISGRFNNISEFAVEAVATPNVVENSNRYVFAMGDPASIEDDWFNMIFFNKLRQFIRHAGGTFSQLARTILLPNQEYHSVYSCEQGGVANMYLDGVADVLAPAICPNIAVPDAARLGFIGASHRSAALPASYKPFDGTIQELVIYSRPLSEEEILNHNIAR